MLNIGVSYGLNHQIIVESPMGKFDPNFGYTCDYYSVDILIPIIGYNIYKENEYQKFHTITILGFIPIFGFPVSI